MTDSTSLREALDEVVDAAHELAQAFSEIRRCSCGRLTRQTTCPYCLASTESLESNPLAEKEN